MVKLLLQEATSLGSLLKRTHLGEAAVTRISKVLIIGGGIAGSTAAIALHKAGIDATIYEAHGPGAEHVGAGFNIATNGLDALAAIDALDATKGLGLPATRISMYNRRARLLGTV